MTLNEPSLDGLTKMTVSLDRDLGTVTVIWTGSPGEEVALETSTSRPETPSESSGAGTVVGLAEAMTPLEESPVELDEAPSEVAPEADADAEVLALAEA